MYSLVYQASILPACLSSTVQYNSKKWWQAVADLESSKGGFFIAESLTTPTQ